MKNRDAFHLSPLLDQEQLTMLIEAGSPDSNDLFLEILELFEQESVQKLEEISEACEKRDFELLGRASHALAGSSANVGGKEVWVQAKEIENLCKQNRGADAIALVPNLESTYAETIAALKAFAEDSKSAT